MPTPTTSLVVVLLLGVYCGSTLAQCSQYVSCNTCINAPITCGWCSSTTTCSEGGPSGPSVGTCAAWQFDHSQVLSQTNGIPINPSSYFVFLAPNEPLDVTIQVLVPQSASALLDVYFLEDSSASFADDIATFKTLVPSLVLELMLLQPESAFGIGTFIEKPTSKGGDGASYTWPTGPLDPSVYITPNNGPGKVQGNELYQTDTNAAVKCPSRPEDGPNNGNAGPLNWNFCNELNLTTNYNAMQNAVDSLVYNGNRDYPENSLEALMFSMVCPIGWRANSKKIVVIATDAKFHYNGQPTDGNWYPFDFPMPNNLDCVKDEWAPGWLPGVGEDYPTIEEVKNLLVANGAIPIFLVTETSGDSSDHLGWYTNIVNNEFGFGFARQMTSDSSNLVDLIVQVLADSSSTLILLTASDDAGVVQSFTPSQYLNAVPGGNDYIFTVTLAVDAPLALDASVTMTVLGVGNCVMTITTTYPCLGCFGNSNTDEVIDRCGVCGGNDACVGCDDVPFSGKQLDQCYVCGGNGQSCLGCDGVPFSNKTVDQCGVCGGNGQSCLGCDGVPFSNATLDQCNVCGGNGTSCLGCDDRPFSGCVVDICGVCCGRNRSCTTGGNSDTSGQAVVGTPQPAGLSKGATAGVAVGSIVGVAAIIAAAALALLSRSAYIKIEQEYKDMTEGVKDNPLYKAQGQWKVNQLA